MLIFGLYILLSYKIVEHCTCNMLYVTYVKHHVLLYELLYGVNDVFNLKVHNIQALQQLFVLFAVSQEQKHAWYKRIRTYFGKSHVFHYYNNIVNFTRYINIYSSGGCSVWLTKTKWVNILFSINKHTNISLFYQYKY